MAMSRGAVLLFATVLASLSLFDNAVKDATYARLALSALLLCPLIRSFGGFESEDQTRLRHFVIGLCAIIFLAQVNSTLPWMSWIAGIALLAGAIWATWWILRVGIKSKAPYAVLWAIWFVMGLLTTLYFALSVLNPTTFEVLNANTAVRSAVNLRLQITLVIGCVALSNLLWVSGRRFKLEAPNVQGRPKLTTRVAANDSKASEFEEEPLGPEPWAWNAFLIVCDYVISTAFYAARVAWLAIVILYEEVGSFIASLFKIREIWVAFGRTIAAIGVILAAIWLFNAFESSVLSYLTGPTLSLVGGDGSRWMDIWSIFTYWPWFFTLMLFMLFIPAFGIVYVACVNLTRKFGRTLSYEIAMAHMLFGAAVWVTSLFYSGICSLLPSEALCDPWGHGAIWFIGPLVLAGGVLFRFVNRVRRAQQSTQKRPADTAISASG